MADAILRCPLLEVGGRTYRVLSGSRGASSARQQQEQYEEAAGARGGMWEEDEGIEEEADDPSIVPDGGSGGFRTEISLDSELFGLIIGQKGRTKQRIEQDTGTEVIIPRRDAQQLAGGGGGGSIAVRGPTAASVARARTQIQLLVSGALQGRQLDYNYFVSLPLANPQTSAALAAFRGAVLADPGAAAAGLEPSVFMHEAHLHLTLCMLKLYSDEARALAAATLASLQPAVWELLAEGPLRVELRGLEYMNDEPGAMHVLYLGVKDAAPGALDRLRRLCDAVLAAFSSAGLLLPQDERPVKLHATVVNTRYRKRSSGSGSGSGPPSSGGQQQQQQQQQQDGRGGGRGGRDGDRRQPFDGRALLAQHGNLSLGQLELPALHLSQRGSYDERSGYYRCAASLALRAGG